MIATANTTTTTPVAADCDDRRLLREYVAHHDRHALELLVRRHIGVVHACAQRQTARDVHLAEDVTQAVFILLASKARTIRPGALLRSWLFSATRYASANALKMQARRRYHERHAAAQRQDRAAVSVAADTETPNLVPLLDEAIAQLGATDRAGILLNFFDNKTFREIGAALGVSEEAARKRVTRAIEKMRTFFAARGFAIGERALVEQLGAGAAIGASALPAGLLESAVASAWSATTAFSGAGAGGTGSAFTIAKGAANMIALAKLKVAAVLALALLLGGGIGVVAIAKVGPAGGDAKAQPPATAPVGSTSHVAKFDDGVEVEVVGITRLPLEKGATWWHVDGSSAEPACDGSTSLHDPPDTYLMCLRASGARAGATVSWFLSGASWSSQPATKDGVAIDNAEAMSFRLNGERKTIDLRCKIATGDWQSQAASDPVSSSSTSGERGEIAFSPAYEAPGGSGVTVTHNFVNVEPRVVAIDAGGAEHIGQARGSSAARNFAQLNVLFDVPLDQLKTLDFQTRVYDHIVDFRNITLDPKQHTNVELIMQPAKP